MIKTHSAKAYARSLEREIKRVRHREQKEYKAALKAKEAEYLRVNPYMLGDMSSPVSAKVVY